MGVSVKLFSGNQDSLGKLYFVPLNLPSKTINVKKCKALSALVAECNETIKSVVEKSVPGACGTVSAQKIKHYEIAARGMLRNFAAIQVSESQAAVLDQAANIENEKAA
jgi:ferritin-like metal-binding protein YciE